MDAVFATNCLARHRALTIVRARYRDAGRKITTIPMTQQRADAQAYIAEHPELVTECAEIVVTTRTKARKSTTSVSQILGAK